MTCLENLHNKVQKQSAQPAFTYYKITKKYDNRKIKRNDCTYTE